MAIHQRYTTAFQPSEGIQTGIVDSITPEGMIVVKSGASKISCYFIRSSAIPPDITIGDSVAWTPSSSEKGSGYVLGLIEPYQPKADRLAEKFTKQKTPNITSIEDEVIRIKADKGLVIECGKSSIILSKDGKLQLKGNELLSRARGMNKIKGAGVNIN